LVVEREREDTVPCKRQERESGHRWGRWPPLPRRRRRRRCRRSPLAARRSCAASLPATPASSSFFDRVNQLPSHTRRYVRERREQHNLAADAKVRERCSRAAKKKLRPSFARPPSDRDARSSSSQGTEVADGASSLPFPLNNRWLTLLRLRAGAGASAAGSVASAGAAAATAAAAAIAAAAAAAGARTRRRSGSRAPSWAASCSR
jgi:hypothetical protein